MRQTVATNDAYKLCYFLILLSFLISMKLWIGWDGRMEVINWGISAILVLQLFTGNVRLYFKPRYVISFIIILFAIIINHGANTFNFIVYLTIQEIPVLFILCISDEHKIECLNYITKYFAYILVPGFIVFILLFFVDIPSFGILITDSSFIGQQSEDYLYRQNYLFYEPSVFQEESNLANARFNGPFQEPGHLGMMGAFLLFVNQFDFIKKKYLWIILVSIILSLSLAGYVLSFMGYFMLQLYKRRMSLSQVFIYSFILLGVYFFGIFYNGGDNFLNNAIFSRLQYDEVRGITGNNRVGDLMLDYYGYMIGDINTLLYGYNKMMTTWMAEHGGRGTGFVYWTVHYGIIGIIYAMAFYFYFMLKSKARYFSLLSFIFIVLMFIQRSYPFWASWVICYVYGIVLAERHIILNRNQKSGSNEYKY